MPNGWKGVHQKTITVTEQSHQQIKHIRKIAKKKQHEVEETNAIILGTQAATYPQVSDVAME